MRRAVTRVKHRGVLYEPGQDLPEEMPSEVLFRLVTLGSATSDEEIDVILVNDFYEEEDA